MSKLNLKEKFPTLMSKLEDDIDELRYLVVVDENYEDIDDEEVDVFDPNDYNYLVYVTERVSKVLGEDGLEKLYTTLDSSDIFENFLASEEDLYGVKSPLNDDEVAIKVIEVIEKIVKEAQE